MILFSKSRKSFFDDRFKDDFDKAGSWPGDTIEISQADYLIYSNTPPEGMCLGSDITGSPSWIEKASPMKEELEAIAEQQKNSLMAVAESTIAPLNRAVKLGVASEVENALLLQWEMYTVLLMRVDTAAPVWPTPPEKQAS